MFRITGIFYLGLISTLKGRLKCDHIIQVITQTCDDIKRLSLFTETKIRLV